MKNVSALSDEVLLLELESLARRERESYPHLLACLAEVERRGLHLDRGFETLFDYCVGCLKYSEGVAMSRIYSARAASKYPEIYALLRDGSLTISALSRLSAHLDSQNASRVLSRAAGKNKRELEELIVEISAQRERNRQPEIIEEPDPQNELFVGIPTAEPTPLVAAASDMKSTEADAPVPEPCGEIVPDGPDEHRIEAVDARPQTTGEIGTLIGAKPSTGLNARRDTIRLEAPGALRISFWAAPEFRQKLEIMRRLVGRTDGRIESILEIVFAAYRERKAGGPRRSRSGRRTRRITKGVRDLVWRRDEGRCSFTAPDGVRCASTRNLEYDHIRPWALGGTSDDPANIRLLCRAHNQHAARKIFGGRVPAARAA